MFRNKLLAKEILELIVSEDGGGGGLYREEIEGVFAEKYPDHEPGRADAVTYHLHILETANLVKLTKDSEDRNQDNFEMTWAGHDFLEAN